MLVRKPMCPVCKPALNIERARKDLCAAVLEKDHRKVFELLESGGRRLVCAGLDTGDSRESKAFAEICIASCCTRSRRAGPAVSACRTRSRCRWATRTSLDDPAQSGQASCPKGELRVLDVFVACRNQEFTDSVKDEMEALHSNMLVSYVSWSDPALSLGFAAMLHRLIETRYPFKADPAKQWPSEPLMTVLRVNAGALRPTLAGVLAYRDAGLLSLDHQGAQGQSLLEAWLQGGQAFLATTLVDIGADLAPVEEKYGSVEAALGQGYPPVTADACAELREAVMRRRMQEQLTPAADIQKMRAGSRARRVEL